MQSLYIDHSHVGEIVRRTATVLAATVASVAAMLITAGPAAASTPSGCSSVSQIGSTGYISYHGSKVASVKQYYGCGKNYSYLWVWESFRDHSWQNASAAILTSNGDAHGTVTKSRPAYEVWSTGADTASDCTRGWGRIQIASEPFVGYSSQVC
ncbi:hypothetical protein ACIP4Q_22625 [Streptomyces massasporeus]